MMLKEILEIPTILSLGNNEYKEITYYKDTTIHSEYYFFRTNKRPKLRNGHRLGGLPSYSVYYENGQVSYQTYQEHGNIHRDGDKPAEIYYNEDGSVFKQHYFIDGQVQDNNTVDRRIRLKKRQHIIKKIKHEAKKN